MLKLKDFETPTTMIISALFLGKMKNFMEKKQFFKFP